jgi:sigma-B regulation protein RsbU (phosphoserine phosphatase)
VESLSRSGLLAGCVPEYAYESVSSTLNPGDLLLGTTDGITETRNESGEEFGRERLVEHARRNAGRPANDLVRSIITAVERFSGGTPATDDRTAIVIKREAPLA